MSLLQQKTKTEWLSKKDTNSRYFHLKIKEKQQKHRIVSITNDQGSILTDGVQIENEFLTYYNDLLGQSENELEPVDVSILQSGPCLTPEQQSNLTRRITDLEVKEAIFAISEMKAPRPDGFISAFFKDAWPIMGKEVCVAVSNFFMQGKLLKQVNCTIVTLTLKCSHSAVVADFRPISCCNVIYKTITRIIAMRMQPLMPCLISRNQGAFVKGRSIVVTFLYVKV